MLTLNSWGKLLLNCIWCWVGGGTWVARVGGHFESLLCINIIFFNIFFNRNFWYMLSLRQYQTGICVVLKSVIVVIMRHMAQFPPSH